MVASTRSHNIVIDALSQKEVIEYVTTLSQMISNFNEKIKYATKLDFVYEKMRQKVKDGLILVKG